MKSLNNLNLFVLLLLLLLLLLLFVLIFLGSIASAAHFSGLRKSLAEPYAHYSTSVSNFGYTSHYDAARTYWNAHSWVNITKTTTLDIRPDLYYVANTSIPGYLGQVFPYDRYANLVGVHDYWDFCAVFLYDNQIKAMPNFTISHLRYVAAHELGHTIKLAHVPNGTYSVMTSEWRPLPQSTITNYDSNSVSNKWSSWYQ